MKITLDLTKEQVEALTKAHGYKGYVETTDKEGMIEKTEQSEEDFLNSFFNKIIETAVENTK